MSQPLVYRPYSRFDLQQSISQKFEKIVQRYPQHIAVKSAQTELTYDALNKAANRLAHAIIRLRGPESEPVILLFGHDIEQYIGMIGVMKSGKFYVPLDPSAPKARNAEVIADTEALVMVTNTKHVSTAKSLLMPEMDIINIDCDIGDECETNTDLAISPTAYAFMLFTSGSTGKSKGVLWRHHDMLHYALTESLVSTKPDDRVLMVTKYFFSGSLGQTYNSLLHGGALYLYDIQEKGIDNLLHWINDNQITVFHATATVYRLLMNILEPNTLLKSVCLLRLGGESVRWTDFELFKQHFPADCVMRIGYGLTEVKHVSGYYVDQDTPVRTGTMPAGYPVEGIEILILNENGEVLGFNEIGEIAVVTQYMASEYWRQPELTAKKFRTMPGDYNRRMYLTGDIGKLLPDGCLIHLGRNDFQVKIRGHRVELGDIESALLAIDSVMETAVVSKPDQRGQVQLVAYIVPKVFPGPHISEIRSLLAHKVPSFLLPAAYVFLPALPQTATGKTDRMALPEPNWERQHMDNAYVAPRNALERHITSLCEDVLGISQVGIYDNFFDLGGDSVKIFQLVNRLQPDDGHEILVKVLFEKGTIADIAAVLVELNGENRG